MTLHVGSRHEIKNNNITIGYTPINYVSSQKRLGLYTLMKPLVGIRI